MGALQMAFDFRCLVAQNLVKPRKGEILERFPALAFGGDDSFIELLGKGFFGCRIGERNPELSLDRWRRRLGGRGQRPGVAR